jgi:hypothetical protein
METTLIDLHAVCLRGLLCKERDARSAAPSFPRRSLTLAMLSVSYVLPNEAFSTTSTFVVQLQTSNRAIGADVLKSGCLSATTC